MSLALLKRLEEERQQASARGEGSGNVQNAPDVAMEGDDGTDFARRVNMRCTVAPFAHNASINKEWVR